MFHSITNIQYIQSWWCNIPVPGLKGIAGPLEQVALHHHTIRSVNIEFHFRFVIGEILEHGEKNKKYKLRIWEKQH